MYWCIRRIGGREGNVTTAQFTPCRVTAPQRITVLACGLVLISTLVAAQTDPGPRSGAAGAGGPVSGLTTKEAKFFASGLDAFNEIASVTGSVAGTEAGLGPRFNLNSCAGCHAQPAVGGSSPASN